MPQLFTRGSSLTLKGIIFYIIKRGFLRFLRSKPMTFLLFCAVLILNDTRLFSTSFVIKILKFI
jgi:hypothetical protein